jgi:two-component system KDP operon response regulator KdpE
MPNRILVVEDDAPTSLLIESCLSASGYEVVVTKDGLEALTLIGQENFDAALLDIMLGDLDGLTLCERIRQFSQIPIIMVTAKDEPENIVKALNIGADDYIIKPFNTKELLARVAAVLRRSAFKEEPSMTEKVLTVGQLTVDLAGRRVMVKDKEVRLTPTEFKLLFTLLSNAGVVLTHKELLVTVWGPEYAEDTHYLRVCVGRIRQKLALSEDDIAYIRTVPTVGYMIAG